MDEQIEFMLCQKKGGKARRLEPSALKHKIFGFDFNDSNRRRESVQNHGMLSGHPTRPRISTVASAKTKSSSNPYSSCGRQVNPILPPKNTWSAHKRFRELLMTAFEMIPEIAMLPNTEPVTKNTFTTRGYKKPSSLSIQKNPKQTNLTCN